MSEKRDENRSNKTVEVHRLTKAAYDELRKQIRVPTIVGPTTTALEAGQIIGVEMVLGLLREGYVIEK